MLQFLDCLSYVISLHICCLISRTQDEYMLTTPTRTLCVLNSPKTAMNPLPIVDFSQLNTFWFLGY